MIFLASYIKVTLLYAMKVYWRTYVELHAFLTSALDGGELHVPVPYPRRNRPPYPVRRSLLGLQNRSRRRYYEKKLHFTPVWEE
jgi:hypothetical protein